MDQATLHLSLTLRLPTRASSLVPVSLPPPSPAKAKHLREAKAQPEVKHEQLKIEMQALHTSVTSLTWTKAEDHVIVQGMKSRKDWREKQKSLAKKIIEIKSIVELNNLVELEEEVKDTKRLINNFSSFLETMIAEIELADVNQGLFSYRSAKTCPIKVPTYAGLVSEDFISFRDNIFSRSDHPENLREVLTGKALVNLPLDGIKNIGSILSLRSATLTSVSSSTWPRSRQSLA